MNPYNTDNPRVIENTLYEFMKKHASHLPIEARDELMDYLEVGNITDYFTSSLLAQVYEEAGLMNPDCSIYHQMFKIIEKHFSLKRDIIEVASGIFPILGHNIHEKQLQLGKGTVTIYDTVVWKQYPTKAVLIKEKFTEETTVKKGSLLVGMFPCDAMNIMIEKAIKEELEFCIALCGCNHSGIRFMDVHDYHEMLIDALNTFLPKGKKLQIEHFPRQCFNEGTGFPILVGKDTKSQKILKLVQSFKK